MVALRLVTAEHGQLVERPRVLDTLGDDGHAEVVREIGRRADDGRVLSALALHAHDEGFVDLQLGHAQLPQKAERGVAGAEVVDRHRDAAAREAEARRRHALRPSRPRSRSPRVPAAAAPGRARAAPPRRLPAAGCRGGCEPRRSPQRSAAFRTAPKPAPPPLRGREPSASVGG